MKHFFLIRNSRNENAEALLQEAKRLILKDPACTAAEVPHEKALSSHTDPGDIPADTEAVLVFGGDGTIIRAVRDIRSLSIPVLGVNAGTLGYLAETDREGLEETIERLKSGRFFVEERMMVSGTVLKKEGEKGGFLKCFEDVGLNDIVLSGAEGTRVLSFSVYVNGEFLKTYTADGLIIATPTGSTAYNLSAGGPIALPSGELLLMTPINAHTLMSRSIVLPGDACVTLEVNAGRAADARLHFDGSVYPGLRPGDRVEIRKAEGHARLIRLDQGSFTEILSKKLEN